MKEVICIRNASNSHTIRPSSSYSTASGDNILLPLPSPFNSRNSVEAPAALARPTWNLKLSVISDHREQDTSLALVRKDRARAAQLQYLDVTHKIREWNDGKYTVESIKHYTPRLSYFTSYECADYYTDNCSVMHLAMLPSPTTLCPSEDIMLPESSQMKNLTGVVARPAIRAFCRPGGQEFLER